MAHGQPMTGGVANTMPIPKKGRGEESHWQMDGGPV